MEWFIGLPLAVQIIGVVLFLSLLFGLGFIGKVNLKIGKNIITFGRGGKRSCADCILLLMAKRERFESQRNFILNRVLKEQMNFAEQKLLELQSILLTSYRGMLSLKKKSEDSSVEINKQYRLYEGILASGLQATKDEVRRSMKENGFEHLKGTEFASYIKNKFITLVEIGKDHINDLYPYEGMIISIEDRMKNLEKVIPRLEGLCNDLFVKAREIKLDAHSRIDKLEKEFAKEMDEFVNTKA